MPTLETDRLTLRPFRPDDWRELWALSVRHMATEAAKFEDPWPTTAAEIRGLAEWLAGRDDYLAVWLRATGRLIGLVAVNLRAEAEGNVHNLGYVFHPEYHGRGYATEACRAVLAYLFGPLAAAGVLTGTRPENAASARLLKRLGLRERDAARGEWAISRDEWLALQPGPAGGRGPEAG